MTPVEVVAWADAIGHICAGALALVGTAGALVFMGRFLLWGDR